VIEREPAMIDNFHQFTITISSVVKSRKIPHAQFKNGASRASMNCAPIRAAISDPSPVEEIR